MKIKTTLTALALSCVASIASAQTTFTFSDDSTVIGAGLDTLSSGSFTVSGIQITATASEPSFNATGSGFGINQTASGDDTAGFDFTDGVGNTESFTLFFDQDVYLNSFSVSSWNAGGDEVTLTDGATVVGTISSTGATTLGSYLLSDGSTLTVATTAGTYGNGWSFDSITVTAVPEPGTYALLAGMLALTSVMLRRRSLS